MSLLGPVDIMSNSEASSTIEATRVCSLGPPSWSFLYFLQWYQRREIMREKDRVETSLVRSLTLFASAVIGGNCVPGARQTFLSKVTLLKEWNLAKINPFTRFALATAGLRVRSIWLWSENKCQAVQMGGDVSAAMGFPSGIEYEEVSMRSARDTRSRSLYPRICFRAGMDILRTKRMPCFCRESSPVVQLVALLPYRLSYRRVKTNFDATQSSLAWSSFRALCVSSWISYNDAYVISTLVFSWHSALQFVFSLH